MEGCATETYKEKIGRYAAVKHKLVVTLTPSAKETGRTSLLLDVVVDPKIEVMMYMAFNTYETEHSSVVVQVADVYWALGSRDNIFTPLQVLDRLEAWLMNPVVRAPVGAQLGSTEPLPEPSVPLAEAMAPCTARQHLDPIVRSSPLTMGLIDRASRHMKRLNEIRSSAHNPTMRDVHLYVAAYIRKASNLEDLDPRLRKDAIRIPRMHFVDTPRPDLYSAVPRAIIDMYVRRRMGFPVKENINYAHNVPGVHAMTHTAWVYDQATGACVLPRDMVSTLHFPMKVTQLRHLAPGHECMYRKTLPFNWVEFLSCVEPNNVIGRATVLGSHDRMYVYMQVGTLPPIIVKCSPASETETFNALRSAMSMPLRIWEGRAKPARVLDVES